MFDSGFSARVSLTRRVIVGRIVFAWVNVRIGKDPPITLSFGIFATAP